MKLVELIVVMVIMGMLAAWALASMPGMPDIREITTDIPTPPEKLDENTVQLRQNGENVNIDLDTGEVISK
jgi:hypothetical protein